jgi:hypothetical protein
MSNPPVNPDVNATIGDANLDETMQSQVDGDESELEDSAENLQNVGRRAAEVRIPAGYLQDIMVGLQQLRAEVASLQEQRQSQQQVVLGSAVPVAPSNPATPTPPSATNTQQGPTMRATPAKPKEFNGISDLKGDRSTAREFMNQLYLYFENVKLSDKEMATCAASYMIGEAGSWATARLKALKAEGRVDSWGEFEAAFRKLYCPNSVTEIARSKLSKLRQGTTSVAEYYQLFQRLCLEIPNMDGATSLDWFVRGLNKLLREKVFLQQPKTLDEAFTLAARLEGLYELLGTSSSSSLTAMDGDEEPKTATTTRIEQQLSQLAVTMQQQQQQLAAFGQQRGHNSNGGGDKDKTKSDAPKCEHCKRRGHTKEKCWKLHKELEPEWMKLKRETTTNSKK